VPGAVVIAVEPEDFGRVLANVRGQAKGDVGVLAARSSFAGIDVSEAVVRTLPEDIDGMARDLYAALRDLDERGVEVIVAALPPAIGLGEAVGDRLLRAAGPRSKKP
jgi:L-threonylcarbamoyladenylate synthase